MKDKFVNFGSIEGVVNQMKTLQHWADYHESKVKTFTAHGNVKIHGTNMGISYWDDGNVTWQTRNKVILPTESDGFGMTFYVNQLGIDTIKQVLKPLLGDAKGIVLFGEFFGKGIQKGVGVSELNKSFMVFAITKVYDDVDRDGKHCWKRVHVPLDSIIAIPENNFYNVNDFKQFSQVVDPYSQSSIDGIMEHTLSVEALCPVATTIDPNIECKVGEGIVWSATVELESGQSTRIIFKSKGEKHKRAVGSVMPKVTKQYTVEQNIAISNFFEVAMSKDRLEQGFEYLVQSGKEVNVKSTGLYIKWVVGDVQKEHSNDVVDILYPVGLQWDDVKKDITNIAKEYFINIVSKV